MEICLSEIWTEYFGVHPGNANLSIGVLCLPTFANREIGAPRFQPQQLESTSNRDTTNQDFPKPGPAAFCYSIAVASCNFLISMALIHQNYL